MAYSSTGVIRQRVIQRAVIKRIIENLPHKNFSKKFVPMPKNDASVVVLQMMAEKNPVKKQRPIRIRNYECIKITCLYRILTMNVFCNFLPLSEI